MGIWPINRWRYYTRIEIEGTDRQNLVDCLEAEDLACFSFLSRDRLYHQIRSGEIEISASSSEPFPAFPNDLATISFYLFQVVKGIEVVERVVDDEQVDDIRAWKVVARQGEWVKFPLVSVPDEAGRFHIDADAPDLEVVRARWMDYPQWFHDGMRKQHPVLRDL